MILKKTKSGQVRLTHKQKKFIDHALAHPEDSLADAAEVAYDVKNRSTARSIASENLNKPYIAELLEDSLELVENAIVGTVRDWKDSDRPREREIAMQNAQYIHDKVKGKATQRVETRSEHVVISIDLTSTDTDQIE